MQNSGASLSLPVCVRHLCVCSILSVLRPLVTCHHNNSSFYFLFFCVLRCMHATSLLHAHAQNARARGAIIGHEGATHLLQARPVHDTHAVYHLATR